MNRTMTMCFSWTLKFLPAALFWVVLLAFSGCSDREGRQAVNSRSADASRPLVVLTQPTEPPFAYRDSSWEIVGKDIDLARRIAAKMGRGLSVEGVEFVEILPRIKAGTADMGIATITITEARQKDVDFSSGVAEPRLPSAYGLMI